MESADAIVASPFAVGKGNLSNLILLGEVAPRRPVYLLTGGPIEKRDYTQGEASRLYRELEANARGKFGTAPELVTSLKRDLLPKAA